MEEAVSKKLLFCEVEMSMLERRRVCEERICSEKKNLFRKKEEKELEKKTNTSHTKERKEKQKQKQKQKHPSSRAARSDLTRCCC